MKTPKLVKHQEILLQAQVALEERQELKPMVRFTNWAITFRLEEAMKPSPQEQFKRLFKGDVQ